MPIDPGDRSIGSPVVVSSCRSRRITSTIHGPISGCVALGATWGKYAAPSARGGSAKGRTMPQLAPMYCCRPESSTMPFWVIAVARSSGCQRDGSVSTVPGLSTESAGLGDT